MIVAPIVNLNGTSKQELLQQHLDAHKALCDALAAMQKCAPHGRDFQTADASVYRVARTLHDQRCQAVSQAAQDVLMMAEVINDQAG